MPIYQYVYGPTGPQIPYQYYQYPQANQQSPFLATLYLPYLFRLINNPIHHDPCQLDILVKLPLDIPKFDGKIGGDPKNHVMNFHILCSSNSLMGGSIHLQLFQRTLTGIATKWYIELPQHSLSDFNDLEMAFLTHFQLPIRYEISTDLLTLL